ncbi:MAG: PhzF family phenazine biosynthesis protein [Solirubrobacterales bacterium]
MPELAVVRVFVGEGGRFGNPLGVFLDGPSVPEEDRRRVAADLGFSETVFVDDVATGELRILTPAAELPFAGHPLLGTAWLLARQGRPPEALRPPVGETAVRFEAGGGPGGAGEPLVHVSGLGEWSAFETLKLARPDEVDALDGRPGDRGGNLYAWAWIDEAAGTVRARSFAPQLGVPEDEATGSAALGLAVELDRELEIHQGRGSLLRARALGGGRGEVGGAVALERCSDYPLSAL